jgi:hypothetical protein
MKSIKRMFQSIFGSSTCRKRTRSKSTRLIRSSLSRPAVQRLREHLDSARRLDLGYLNVVRGSKFGRQYRSGSIATHLPQMRSNLNSGIS